MNSIPTVALSIRQPWAFLIASGVKDIENRKWKTPFRGRFLIHASLGMTRLEYDETAEFAETQGIIVPEFDDLARGGIIGEAEITDCVRESDSPWFFGPYGFVIRNAKPMRMVPCKGRLGFFNPHLLSLDPPAEPDPDSQRTLNLGA